MLMVWCVVCDPDQSFNIRWWWNVIIGVRRSIIGIGGQYWVLVLLIIGNCSNLPNIIFRNIIRHQIGREREELQEISSRQLLCWEV